MEEKMREEFDAWWAVRWMPAMDHQRGTPALHSALRELAHDAWHASASHYELQLAAAQADNVRLREALNHVDAYLDDVPHGDNCFVSNHYEGDPGNRCNCGKDAVCQNVDEALAHPLGTPALDAYLATLTAWHPIETAPKDGTKIIAWRKFDGANTVFWGNEICGRYGWQNDDATFPLAGKYAFTHWTQLPASPSPDNQKE